MRSRDHNAKAGDDAAGYWIRCPSGGIELHIQGWGFWNAALSTQFSREVSSACRQVSSPLRVILELARLKPQGDDGQAALRTLFQRLAGFTLTDCTVCVDSVLTKMQLLRLMREQGMEASIQFVSSGDSVSPSLSSLSGGV